MNIGGGGNTCDLITVLDQAYDLLLFKEKRWVGGTFEHDQLTEGKPPLTQIPNSMQVPGP